jgi:signal peptidase
VSDETTAEVEPESPKPPAKERSLAYYLGVMLSVVLLLFVGFFAVILIIIPKVGDAIPLTVLTQSMRPGLPPGTLLIVKPVDPDAVQIGDVITYQIRSGDPAVITHRVIGVTESGTGVRQFILQGDNNDLPDDPVIDEQIQGRLWYSVPYVGFVNTAVNGENRSWIVAVIAGLFFAYAGYMIIGGIAQAVRKKKGTGRRAAGR